MNAITSRTLIGIAVLTAIAVVAWGILTMPDNRTSGERVGDAIDALPRGVGNAAEQLGDRTPGQKLGDAVEKAGEKIQDNTDR